MGVWVTEPTCVGARKHIWRVWCGPGVFGNSSRRAASVDFIILIAKHGNVLKARTHLEAKGEHAGIRPKPGGCEQLRHWNRWPVPVVCTLPWDRCLHVWSLVITASANYLETRRHCKHAHVAAIAGRLIITGHLMKHLLRWPGFQEGRNTQTK